MQTEEQETASRIEGKCGEQSCLLGLAAFPVGNVCRGKNQWLLRHDPIAYTGNR